jgi:RNA polymerase sigma-70 factor, ECF subfamily
LAVAGTQPADSGRAESDQQRLLVEAARARDEAAWSQLFDENFHSLYVYAFTRVHNHHAAEELAAQVFEEAIRGIKSFRYRGAPIRAWLFRIAHNVTSDYLAKAARRPVDELFEAESELDELVDSGVRVDFLRGLAVLTDEQRQVITLRFVNDLSVEDTAHVIGKSEGAVKMAQARGLERLREEMADYRGNDE